AQPPGNAGNSQLVRRLVDEQLITARLRRRLKDAVRLVRQIFVAAEQPDQPVDAVVVRRDVAVADRPIVTEAVACLPLKIPWPKAERDAPPVIRAPAEHPRAPPQELRPFGNRVRLALDLP